MAFVDYYKILGVDKNIPQKDVRAAYRKRAKQFHPDLHPNDPKAKAKFQALNEAYEVISDPDKRAKYDQYGEQWKNAGGFGSGGFGGAGGAAGGNPFEGFDFSSFGRGGGGGGFSSFFENLFGGGRAHGGQRGGFGGFGGFSGFGNTSGTGYGAGYGAGAGFGTGGCNGGCGGQSAGSGEMEMNVNIDMYTALLGGEGIVQLSNGSKIKLKIKPETQNGTKVRVRGKGYNLGNGTCGDLIITYTVKLPTGLNDRQKELLRQMKEAK